MGATRKRVTPAEIARLAGVHDSTVSRWRKDPTFPQPDESGKLEAYEVFAWLFAREQPTGPALTDDTLMAGEGSDGLERYRLARAQQEEIKLAEIRGQVVRLSDFAESIGVLLQPFRRFAEHLKRTGQTDLFEMLDEVNSEVESGLGAYDAHDGTAEPDIVD